MKNQFQESSVSELKTMEGNSKQKMQPVRGSTFEQTKTDTISDMPVSTKCPKCGSVVSKAEKVLGKYWLWYFLSTLKKCSFPTNCSIDLILSYLFFVLKR